MRSRKAISIMVAAVMSISLLTPFSVCAADNTYTCDFTQLIKNNADTSYGTADDIIRLDDCTTAYLTYEGTHVKADGTLYLYGGNNGKGAYTNGSYIEFTAPADGTLTPSFGYANYFIDGIYAGYSASAVELKAGQKFQIGERINDRSYVTGLSFTYSGAPEETEAPSVTDEPTEELDIPSYTSPTATWDFDTYAPAQSGVNIPCITGQATYADSEIQFPASSTGTGSVVIDFDEPIHNNVELSFDIAGHSKHLGQQYAEYIITNSEGDEVVAFRCHPYDASVASYLRVGGAEVENSSDASKMISTSAAKNINTKIDYNARKVTVTDGSVTLTGTLPEYLVKDVAKFEFKVTRTKIAADRYISFDNLIVSEFTSTEAPAAVEITNGYEEKTLAGISSRVKTADGLPLLVYLSEKTRFGIDNYSQLYNAQNMFELMDGKTSLAAPQAPSGWDASELKSYIEELKTEINASVVIVAGQGEGAEAAYALAANGAADKIIPIAGTSDISSSSAKVWAFGGFLDDKTAIADIRRPVNALQLSGADVRYTEYPTEGHNISKLAAQQEGLSDWIISSENENKVVDLVVFAGQSNMAGRGSASEAVACPPGMGYEFHSVANPRGTDGNVPFVLSTVTEPFGKTDNNDNIHDAGSNGIDRRAGDMVAALMKTYYEKTGVPIVGVQASRGGQETRYFVSAQYKDEALARFNEAADYLTHAGYTIRKKFMVWCQGEADADNSRSESVYKGNTQTIFNNFKTVGVTDMFIIKTGHYNYGQASGTEGTETQTATDARYAAVNRWQQEFADATDNVYAVADLYTDAYLAQMRDQYHFYQPVYNEIGTTAGEAIAAIYAGEPIPTAQPTAKPTQAPEATQAPAATDEPGVSYEWDFETDPTAASGSNMPVISGTAAYDATNKNIRLSSETKTAGEVKVTLSPAAEGVVTADFDMQLGQLGSLSHVITAADSAGEEIVKITFDIYNATGTLTIGGAAVAADREFTRYINSYRGDGMSAEVTHFNIEVNYPKRTASVTITKNASTEQTFTGTLAADTYSAQNVASLSVQSVHGKYTTGRDSYLDNLKIASYKPSAAIYAAGAQSVTKRLGMSVNEAYSLSKTYSDDSEIAEWSVEGVTGVTIDKATGVLTVPENAGTGTARVTVTLTKGGTLPTGTSDTIDVEIKDFAQPSEYVIGGSTTIAVGSTTKLAIEKLLDTDGNDITEFAILKDFASSNSSVASALSDGTITANKAGTADITYTLAVDRLGYTKSVTQTVKAGAFEITSSASSIDVSALISYGTDTYRVYRADKSYEDVRASGVNVQNTTGGEVTVVPIYRFNYTNAAIDGYTDATGAYSASAGYGLISGVNYNTNANGSLPVSGRPLHVDLPYGSYDMNILRKGGARADVYNDGIQIVNNTTSAGSQNRPSDSGLMYAPQVLVTDGSADITIGNTSGSNERIATVEIVRVPDGFKKPVIWIAGDSESANYYPIDADGDDLASDKIMMTGFGMQLPKLLSDDYKVANFGQPSATVKTWYDECFDSVLYRMENGDTIIVDFGINDAVSSSNAISKDVMKHYMKDIFEKAQAKGVLPILVSPLWNSKYQHRTYFTYNAETGINEMYAFAKECGVPCIDLNKGTMLYKDDAIAGTGDDTWVTKNYHVGDNLHQTQHSAVLCAAIIAGGMKQLGYKTTDFADIYKDLSSLDEEDSTKRGVESGISREYSISALANYITVNGAESLPTDEPVKEGIEVSGKTVTVTLKNAENAVLVKASYDKDDRMTSVKAYPITLANYMAVEEIADLTEGDVLLVWDSLTGQKPLTESVTVGAAQAAPTVLPTAKPTAAPTEKPTAAPTAAASTEEPAAVLYSQDFESFSEGANGGWTSPAGTLAIKSDSTSGIGKYQTIVSGKSGTCRSGYVEIPAVTQNFVFECDYKSTSNANVSDLELVESKGSIYANHGVYSNQNFVFTMARPKGSDAYVINNKTDDSGLTIDRYTAPAFTTGDITGNQWLHVKAVGNYDTQTVMVYITSLDGKTEYYRGVHDMNVGREKSITSWKCIHLLSPTMGGDTCIDNIVVKTATTSDLAPVYHRAKITLGAVSFEQYVLDGRNVVNIPSADIYGEAFEGWMVDDKLYSTAELEKLAVNADCEITGQISADYIEALSAVEFKDFPAGNELVMGADENTYGDNAISLSITGEQGTSLVTSPDERVMDYRIDWEFDGFRTLDGTPTGETGEKYCDSYGLIEITDAAQSSVNFRLKKTSANYWGRVKAKVTYNGKTIEVEQPLVLLGDKSNTDFLPRAGYASDYKKFEDSMIGYRVTANDIVTGGWNTAGSDGTAVNIESGENGKYMSVTRALTGNSSYLYNTVGQITSQTVFEQDVRFGLDATISYMDGTVTETKNTAFSLAYSGGSIKLNGQTICAAASGTWYHISVTADPTSKLCFAKVYDMSGTLLGETGSIAFDSTYTSGKYYRIAPSKARGSVDVNNIRVYEAQIASVEITVPDTAAIPESGTTELTLSASALTTDGDAAIGLVSWTIDDELADGVTVEITGNSTAKLTITSAAASGGIPIRASVGGKSAVKEIKLTGTKNNVAFTSAPAGIQVGKASEYTYAAELRNGNAETIDGNITYSLVNADGTAAEVSGVEIDSASGRLSVTASAQPQTIYVKAASGGLSKLAKTVLYSLNFSFGTNAPSSGFTKVTSDMVYSDARGFGIEGTASDEAYDMTGSGFTFKVRLEKGRVYNVKAKYQGTVRCERVNADFTGFERTKDSLGEDSYSVAVFGDDVMDITVSSSGKLASIEISEVNKTAAAKPDWWTIGDSTVQQNGSWGYTIASDSTTDLSRYPELAAVINGFHNSGKAGEQHKNFYSNGRLNAILTQMNPGDIVSISGMGTNDSSSSKEQFKAYDAMYVNAILDMGGYVILGSYTPTGNYGATQGKVYDADTMTFKGMRTNAYDLAIRELYEEIKDNENVLGFVDIGKMADEKMTADVRAAYEAAGNDAAAATAMAEEMMSWWKDYNHYYTTFANYILPDITKAVSKLVSGR